jgi:hypothetical protein
MNNIAYYITSHGFGHGVRSCTICNNLPADVGIFLRTLLPATFFVEELKRPYTLAPASFDCGCLQTDSITVDIKKTLDIYKNIADCNSQVLEREVEWCIDNNIKCIVSDIVPFAFEVASVAGIQSVAATNFTWYDIYREYCDSYPDFTPYLEKMIWQYECADILMELSPANPMPYFARRIKIPPIGRTGINIRDKLNDFFKIDTGKHLGLVYTGTFGMDSMPWHRLEKFDDWEFVGLYELPENPSNYHVISKKRFRYEDIVASCDVVFSKIGYGVYAESLLNGKPLVYLPRDGFAEYAVLSEAITNYGFGYCLKREDYCELNWQGVMSEILSKGKLATESASGAAYCAQQIEKLIGNSCG